MALSLGWREFSNRRNFSFHVETGRQRVAGLVAKDKGEMRLLVGWPDGLRQGKY
jgi:hypothetical protein